MFTGLSAYIVNLLKKIRMAKTKESRERQLNGAVGWEGGGGAVGADAHSNK